MAAVPGDAVSARFVRWAVAILAVLATGYIVICALLFFGERQALYHPQGTRSVAPATDGPSVQVTQITTADGERLVAWYLPPQEGQPTFLFFYGNGSSLALSQDRWRRIAEAGVGFLAIGYRGYDGSTGHPTEAGLALDARAAYDWLRQRTPPNDIVIHGYSLGSGVAVRLASEVSARALVLEAPFTSTVDVAADRFPWVPVRLLMRDQFRSDRRIGQVQMPILMLHGDADAVIPIAYGQRLYAMAPRPRTFVTMHGSDHNTLMRDGAYDAIWAFLGVERPGSTAYAGHQAETMVMHDP